MTITKLYDCSTTAYTDIHAVRAKGGQGWLTVHADGMRVQFTGKKKVLKKLK